MRAKAFGSPKTLIRRPSGSSSPKNFCTKRCEMIATSSCPARSASVKLRPRTIGVPVASKKPARTNDGGAFQAGCPGPGAGRPSIAKSQTPTPLTSGTVVLAVAMRTPGMRREPLGRRVEERVGFRVVGVRRPRQVDVRKQDPRGLDARVGRNQASEALHHQRGADDQHDGQRDFERDQRSTQPRAARSGRACVEPKRRRQLRRARSQRRKHAKQARGDDRDRPRQTATRASRRRSRRCAAATRLRRSAPTRRRASPVPRRRRRRRRPASRSRSRPAAPAASVPEPSAARIADSRARRSARASTRLATLAQTIRNRNAVAASRIVKTGRTSPTVSSSIGVRNRKCPVWMFGYCCFQPAISTRISLSAASNVTSSFNRPIASVPWLDRPPGICRIDVRAASRGGCVPGN